MKKKSKFTVEDGFDCLRESNGAVLKVVTKDKKNKPVRAVIWVEGELETQEIIDAIEHLEELWHG